MNETPDQQMSDNEFSEEGEIVFICGALRSGTTLLRLMLNHHPALSNPGEMDFLFECPDRDVVAYREQLKLDRIFLSTGMPVNDALDYPALVHSFVDTLRRPDKRLSINIHRNFERIPAVFPNARYVHILRDPRDVARSSIGMGWAGNVYHGADHWIRSEQSFDRLRRLVPADRIYEIKNETLVTEPSRELGSLCAFLGVPYDAAMLSYPDQSTYSAPDPSLLYQWKREQSRREVGLVEGRVGAMLEAAGYEPSGYGAIVPNTLERVALNAGHRWGRLMFSVRRNGLALTLADIVSRRLPLEGWRRKVVMRLNDKEARHLK